MQIDLSGQVVIVTGGAGLIGTAFVSKLAECGAIPVIADLNEDKGKELLKSIGENKADYFALDITSKDSISSMIKYLNDKHGRIDALVNNAFPRNKNYGKHFFDVEYKDFCEHLNHNVGGYFLTAQQLASYFKDKGKGNIVNIGSIYGVVPPSFEVYDGTSMTSAVEYAAIKAGVIHLTKYMAKYFKDFNIRVNSISPGGVADGQDPKFLKQYREKTISKGMLDPEDLSGTLVYLLSDLSSHVYGQNIVVDDGFVLS